MLKFLIAALLAAPALSAQLVTADNCVHQAGDNPDWARADFDDRQWSKQFPRAGSPYIWTRCRMDLSSLAPTEPVHLGVDLFAAREVFVDGLPAGSHGDIRNGFFEERFQQHALPSAVRTGATVTVALRQLPGRFALRPQPTLLAAGKNYLQLWYSNKISARIRTDWFALLSAGLNIIVGIVLLVLFAFSGDRIQRELLWFGLWGVCAGVIGLSSSSLGFAVWVSPLMAGLSRAIMSFASPRIFFAFARRPITAFWHWLSIGVAGMQLLQLAWLYGAPIAWERQILAQPLVESLVLLNQYSAFAAFWPLRQVPGHLHSARNLSLLFAVGTSLYLWPRVLALQAYQGIGFLGYLVTLPISMMGLIIVIAQRHQQIAAERAELQGEMKAAQEVQRLLTSSSPDVAPWASVEMAYLPAKVVGGDFYFCRQTPEGQLIVVGDVSGKGLRAAMLASVALGSLRSIDTSSPAQLLESLNNALHGQTGGGFVTCTAALIRPDGQISVASAGHPAPYLDGHEMPVESGLPLGIVANVSYAQSTSEGACLLLVSDGVVEAENAQRELFGFDRTRAISTKPAQEIAEAAKAWGQNDDITVVTVRRAS